MSILLSHPQVAHADKRPDLITVAACSAVQLLYLTPCPGNAQVGGILDGVVDNVSLAMCYPSLFPAVSRVTLTPARQICCTTHAFSAAYVHKP